MIDSQEATGVVRRVVTVVMISGEAGFAAELATGWAPQREL